MTSLIGDVSVEVQEQVWHLRLDMNAMCNFEGQTSLPPFVWLELFEQGKVVSALHLRVMVWAMLQRHHPGATLAQAGDLLDQSPDILRRVIAAAMPRQEDAPAGGQTDEKKHKAPSMWRRFIAAISAMACRLRRSGR